MNKLEVKQLLATISTLYPTSRLEPELVSDQRRLWSKYLDDVPTDLVERNLERHIKTGDKFPPTLADLCRPIEPEKDFSARYHEGMKASAEQHLANLDEWRERAVGPTPEQRERVRAAFAKRGHGSTATGES